MFRAVTTAISLAVLSIVGLFAFLIASTLWGSGESAKWAAFFLGLTTATLIFVAFMGLDWINDAQASRAARQFQENANMDMQDNMKSMQQFNRAMATALMAQKQLPQAAPPPMVDPNEDLFNDFG